MPVDIRGYFKKYTRDKWDEKNSEEFAEIHARREQQHATQSNYLKEKRMSERMAARDRKQKQRKREVEKEIKYGKRGLDGSIKKRKLVEKDLLKSAASNARTAAIKAMKKRLQAKCCNYFKPALWKQVDAAAKACLFRTREMVKMLKLQAGEAENFKSITAGTISYWIDNLGYAPKWNQWTLERVEMEGKRVGSIARLGQPRMLVNCPVTIVKRIKNDLAVNRSAGLPVSNTITHAIILAHLQESAPEILTDPRFKCSQHFVKAFLHNKMGWSHRTVT